jgi:hypothetical protein
MSVVPFKRTGRTLPDLTVKAPEPRMPTHRCVAVELPVELVSKIDAIARRELQPRSAWLRSTILMAVREDTERVAS